MIDLNRAEESRTRPAAAVTYTAPEGEDLRLGLVEEALRAVAVKKLEGSRLAQETLVVKKLSAVERNALLLEAMAGKRVAVILSLKTSRCGQCALAASQW